MKILLNYNYDLYPYTTASYLEMAMKDKLGCKVYRKDEIKDIIPDFVLNVQPVEEVIKIKGVPSLYYEIDNHILKGNDVHFYDRVDMVLLAQYQFKEYYEGYKIADLPLAADPKFNKRYKDESQLYDIGLLGNDTYPERSALLEMLKQNFNVLTGEAKPGEPYSRKLNQCKMIFNRSMMNDVNMRFFEAISCGRLLLTDYLPEQEKYAEDEKHYIIYKDGRDLIAKVKFYLNNEKEREAIAKAGMKHIHKYHTYKHRLDTIIRLVKEKF